MEEPVLRLYEGTLREMDLLQHVVAKQRLGSSRTKVGGRRHTTVTLQLVPSSSSR